MTGYFSDESWNIGSSDLVVLIRSRSACIAFKPEAKRDEMKDELKADIDAAREHSAGELYVPGKCDRRTSPQVRLRPRATGGFAVVST